MNGVISNPVWTPATGPTFVIATNLTTVDGIRTADCDFWRPLYDAL